MAGDRESLLFAVSATILFSCIFILLSSVRSRNFLPGKCFYLQFCSNSEPKQQDNVAKMVFIVHGAASLVNDQNKTVTESVLRVCIPPA